MNMKTIKINKFNEMIIGARIFINAEIKSSAETHISIEIELYNKIVVFFLFLLVMSPK
jgi:hypothetical protein